MEFLSQNLINTATQIAVNSNTVTASDLFSTDPYFQYFSDGKNNDALPVTVTITFDVTTTVDRIALLDMNLKSFRLFYNGSTANMFDFTGLTSTGIFVSNSSTSIYMKTNAPVNVSSVTLQMDATITPNLEKHLGFFYIGTSIYELSRTPSSSDYKPKVNPKQVVHMMSDGGVRINRVRKKRSTTIKYDYISAIERNALLAVYDRQDPFFFCPFGTSTGWDGIFFEANWDGSFDFYEYSDDASSSGFSGGINLKETPS